MSRKYSNRVVLFLILAALAFIHSCDNGLKEYLELQRTMIPVDNGALLIAVLTDPNTPDGAVIGIISNVRVDQTIVLTQSKTLTLIGWENVTVIPETGCDELFKVQSGTLNLGDRRAPGTLTLDGNGRTVTDSALIQVEANLTMNAGVVIQNNNNNIVANTRYGGGVEVHSGGTFNMYGGTIRNNVVSGTAAGLSGGGVALYGTSGASCTFIMHGGSIVNNTVWSSGGGVYLVYSTFTMSGGSISNNTADGIAGGGGGIFSTSTGSFIMKGGIIAGNISTSTSGGGVSVSGMFTMTGGTIVGNTASNSGGGVNTDGTFTMSGGSITGNKSTGSNGGGVSSSSGTFTISGGSITGNTAGTYGGGVYIGASSNGFSKTGSAFIDGYSSGNDPAKNRAIINGHAVSVGPSTKKKSADSPAFEDLIANNSGSWSFTGNWDP